MFEPLFVFVYVHIYVFMFIDSHVQVGNFFTVTLIVLKMSHGTGKKKVHLDANERSLN